MSGHLDSSGADIGASGVLWLSWNRCNDHLDGRTDGRKVAIGIVT